MRLPAWLRRALGRILFEDRVEVGEIAPASPVNAYEIATDPRLHTYIDPVSRIGIQIDIETPVEGSIDGRVVKMPLKQIMEIVGEKAVLDPIFKQLRENNDRVHIHHPGAEN